MRIMQTVDIDAPPQRVFDVTVDVERWAEWTPSIEHIEVEGGRLGLGATAIIKQPCTSAGIWRVTEWVTNEHFEWVTTAPGVQMVGIHHVEPLEDGRTRASLGVETSGPLAPLFNLFLKGTAARFIRWEARGLKRRCEDPRYLWKQHAEEAQA